ncbi:MAG: hypothetical protein K2X46_16675 [Roseomonas sp.]|nr:hypothetical protein [Roseomonas sp.]
MSDTYNGNEIIVTIDAGQSDAPVALTGRQALVWLDTPVGFEGTSIRFFAQSPEGLRAIRDIYGNQLTLTLGAAGSRHALWQDQTALNLAQNQGLVLQAWNGTAAVPQTAPRDLRLWLRGIV